MTTAAIPVTWRPEASADGEPARLLTAMLRADPAEACRVANRAQQIARERAAAAGETRAWVEMEDWAAAVAGRGVVRQMELPGIGVG